MAAKKRTEVKTPKQQELPGMEDREIKELEEAAEEYADIRDRRQELTTEEVKLKGQLLNMMKRHKKTEYKRERITIRIVTEKETVKVRIKKEVEEE